MHTFWEELACFAKFWMQSSNFSSCPPAISTSHGEAVVLYEYMCQCWQVFKCSPFCGFCIFIVNPRPAGVWFITCPAGGGGKAPSEISQTTGPISKFQTPFDNPVRELPVQDKKFDPEVTDDVTGQVKVRVLDFSGLVTSASKILILSANKSNESTWIVSLTSVSIISCALWP